MDILNEVYTKNNNKIELFSNGVDTFEKTVLFIGVFHGDEPQGEFLIKEYIKQNKKGKNRLLFIPSLNPDGMALNTRTNANSVDLNRNFPTKNWVCGEKDSYWGGEGPASEIETRFVVDVIEKYSPDCIFTFHTPYKIVNYDGPALDVAQVVSDIFNYPVESDIGYPTPGSFGTYCGVERNIPTITLEMDENENKKSLITKSQAIFEHFLNEF